MNLLLAGRGNNAEQISLQAGIDNSSNSIISANLIDSGNLSGVIVSGGISSIFAFGFGHNLEDYAFQNLQITDNTGTVREVAMLVQANDLGSSLTFEFFIRGDHSNGSVTSSPEEWMYINSYNETFDPSTGKSNTNFLNVNLTGFAGGATSSFSIDVRGLRVEQGPGGFGTYTTNKSNIFLTGIETQVHAEYSMSVLAQRQQDISASIGQLGAIQSRLSSAHSVISSQAENLLSAKSRIQDADVAQDAALLASAQIKQQTAAKILELANKSSDLALLLL